MNPPAELSDCPSTDTTHQTWRANESYAPSADARTLDSPWTKTHLRVPQDDRSVFARPSLTEAAELARTNQSLLESRSLHIEGRSLTELRRETRRLVFELAREYMGELLDRKLPETTGDGPLICSGHQPALFHAGVWIKNFAIHNLAEAVGGTAMNLVIDNDVIGTRKLRVPVGTREQPNLEDIPFDEDGPRVPWEEARVRDPEQFQSFAARVEKVMGSWGIEPLLSDIWPVAVAEVEGNASLRDAFTAARIHLEQDWGLANYDVPLSRVSETEPFLWFGASILTRLPKFWETHNSVLREFRAVNRIRSRTHPVPELAETGGWYEAPFWVWEDGETERLRVFAKACSREVRLSDGSKVFARLPISATGDVREAVAVLGNLPKQGIRFRTRALTTTLFARLFLSDLFVHGIGGAKYDEMTDRIVARFFGITPPGFLTLSCTAHLPLPDPFEVDGEEERGIEQRIRGLEFNPETQLGAGVDSRMEKLIREKRSLIQAISKRETSPDTAQRKRTNYERHTRIKEINRQLAPAAEPLRRLLESELATVRRRLRANRVLQNREFSFALFPASALCPFLQNAVNV